MNSLNAGLARAPQGARVAIVAHDHRDAPLDAAIGTGIQQALKRGSLVRRENSHVHGSDSARPMPSRIEFNLREL
jgi:hypothetical protein